MSSFAPATREQNLLRMAMQGQPGAGKTLTSLIFAQRLAAHYGGDIAVIDAEHGRSRRYANMRAVRDGAPLAFQVCTLADFSPAAYTAKIEEAGRSGFRVLVIDSFSHEWAGRGGVLSLKDAQGAKERFSGWAKINPLHDRVIEAILGSPCHVICTIRSKVKHILEENEKGQQTPRKVGVGAIQRPGTEYEFEIYGELDRSHILTITKSMCPAIDNAIIPCPGPSFIDTVIEWLETGEAAKIDLARRLLSDEQMQVLLRLVAKTNYSLDKLKSELLRRHRVQEIADLRPDQADQEITRLRALLASHARTNGSGATQTTAATVAATVPVHSPPPSPPSQAAPSPTGSAAPPSPELATDAQLARLASLRDELAKSGLTPAQWKTALAKRGVDTARKLTVPQADEFIAALSHRIATLQIEAGILGTGASPPNTEESAAPDRAAEKSGESAIAPRSP